MAIAVDDIKTLLVNNGFQNANASGNDLNELAREISESIEGMEDRRAMADTIYGNLVASGIDFTDADNLMGIAENIAHSISTSSNKE